MQTTHITPKQYNARYEIDDELLSSAVFHSLDSIIITTTDLKDNGPQFVYVNPGFTRMTGYEPEDVLGKTPRILQGPRTDQNVLARLRNALDNNEVFHGCTINYRKDGSEFYNEWHIEPIWDHEGQLVNYMAIQRDVTEQIESQQAIEQKNLALREILEQIEIEKKKIKDNILINIEEILIPAIQKLRRRGSKIDQKYLDVLEASMKDISSGFGSMASHKNSRLSPREVEIANLVKNGLSSKEICQVLNISFKTVETHRNKIRKKLGIINKDINLTSFLQSI